MQKLDVNIRTNKCKANANGYSLVVSLRNGIQNTYFSGKDTRIELRPRDNKLIFREGPKGYKLNQLGPSNSNSIGFRITKADIAQTLLKYAGEYVLLKDKVRGYYYIDLNAPKGVDIVNTTVEDVSLKTTELVVSTADEFKKTEWYTSAIQKQELVKANEDLEFQKKYIEELEEENKLLKDEIITMRDKATSLQSNLPKQVKAELKEECLNVLRRHLSEMEYVQAQAINELIAEVFEGKKVY